MRGISHLLLLTPLLAIVIATGMVHANDATSASFILRDAIVGTGGVNASSSSFQVLSESNTIVSGRDMTSTNFEARLGSQYYPYSASGTLTAVQNGAAIDLSWTASQATLGLNVSGYNVGIASITGGPYTYTNVGNTTSYTYTGLTPGSYYFVVQTLDGLSNAIAVSNEQTVTLVQSISFSLSDTSIGFGTISSSMTRYATGDTLGSTSETEAHQLAAATNAPYGYSISVRGQSPTNGLSNITAIGATNTAPTSGSDQFGIRLTATGGSATISSPYSASGFAYDATASLPSQVATNTTADALTTTFGVRYVANVSNTTASGAYATALVYTVTANF